MGRKKYQEPARRPRRSRKRRKRRLYAAAVFLLGVVIAAMIVLMLFHIQKIEVKGNEYCTKQEIVKTVQNDKYSTNALYILIKYALGRGEALPCLDSMKISLRAPWILKITVSEKTIIGYLNDDNQYIYFDKEGLVVRKGTSYISDVPAVEGIKVKNTELYQKLKSDDDRIFKVILETSQELHKHELSMDKVVCESDRIYLYVDDICISLGTDVTSEKLAQVKPIIEKLEGKKGTLHLENYSDGTETITFEVEKPKKDDADKASGDNPEGTSEENPNGTSEGNQDGISERNSDRTSLESPDTAAGEESQEIPKEN